MDTLDSVFVILTAGFALLVVLVEEFYSRDGCFTLWLACAVKIWTIIIA